MNRLLNEFLPYKYLMEGDAHWVQTNISQTYPEALYVPSFSRAIKALITHMLILPSNQVRTYTRESHVTAPQRVDRLIKTHGRDWFNSLYRLEAEELREILNVPRFSKPPAYHA